jgi:predicted amidohydrolase YtcJ
MMVLTACSGTTATDTTSAELPTASTTSPDPSAPTTSISPPTPNDPPDLILHNGNVLTVDDGFTIVEAIAVTDGDVSAVGTSVDLLALAGSDTKVVDLGGRTVMPGFVDPHTHHMQVAAPNLDGMLDGQAFMIEGGTTTNGEPHVNPDQLVAFRALDEAGDLIVRTHLYLVYNDFCDGRDLGDDYLGHTYNQDADLRLAIAGVKMFADGGACRAPAVSDEYLATTPDSLKERGWIANGDLYVTPEEVTEVVTAVDAAGGITVIHAIGDLAIASALEGLRAANTQQPFAHHQRIDHNSLTTLLTPDQLAIYGELDMVPVVFSVPWGDGCDPANADLWGRVFAESTLSVLENSAALQEANPGLRISWHGDSPSIPGQPFQLMFTAVTGGAVDIDTGEPCYPPAWDGLHIVDTEQAIRRMTINAAAAMGIDEAVGSLEVGKVADLLILADDPFHADPEIGIAANRPLVTMINGQSVFCEGDLCEHFGGDIEPEEPIEVPGGWTPVDHPLVVAIRASESIEPPANAVDSSEETSWVSGADALQWIELDLGSPVDVDTITLIVNQFPPGLTVHEITAGAHDVPGMSIAVVEGETDWGDRLEVPINKTVQFIRITTTTSPSWVAWIEIEVEAAS